MSLPWRLCGAFAPWIVALAACGMLDTKRVIEKPPVTLVSGQGAVVTVTDDQTGSPVELRSDQTLTVRLRFAGTTASDWRLAGFTPSVLQQAGPTQYEQDNVAAQYGEVAGTQIWHFTVLKAGQTELRFELRVARSLEPPTATASFAVTAR